MSVRPLSTCPNCEVYADHRPVVSRWPLTGEVTCIRCGNVFKPYDDDGPFFVPYYPRKKQMATTHELKVAPPYFDPLLDGSKTFEVRNNDRGFQKGDRLHLREWGRHSKGLVCPPCNHAKFGCDGCHERDLTDHYGRRSIDFEVTYVYSSSFDFHAVLHGYVVLGLGPVDSKAVSDEQ